MAVGEEKVLASAFVMLGAGYLVATPSLWKVVICPLIISVLVGLVITIVLFAAALAPQAEALIGAGVADGWAWFLAVVFVLIESVVLSALAVVIAFGTLRQSVFDKTYAKKANPEAQASMKHADATLRCKCCHECRSCGRLGLVRFALMIVTLPLNVVPILGTAAWAYLNGVLFAWDLHSDYFVAHGVTGFTEQRRITQRDPFYHSFGSAALCMEAIPVAGLFFMFSNAAGAALYAAKYEPALSAGAGGGAGVRAGSSNATRTNTASQEMPPVGAQQASRV